MILGQKIIYIEIIVFSAQLFYFSCSTKANENSCPENLAVTNSGFEDEELKGWIDLGNSHPDEDAYKGGKSLKVSGGDGGVQRFFPASPGERFTLTLYLKIEGNSDWAGYGIDFQNAQGETIAEHAMAPELTGIYRQYSISRQAPDNAVQVEIWIYRKGGNGSLFADEICFRHATGI